MDALGNRTTVNANGVTTQYTADNMNAYTAIAGGQNMSPQYDANGNLTNDGVHTYQYNYNNRLVGVDNGQTATYKYDALNRRIQKTVGNSTIRYFYCGDQAIEERNGSNSVLATYLFGVSVDDVLQMKRGGLTYYYHKNHLGSVVALSDGNGNLVERYEYDPYGQPFFFDANDNVLSQSAVGNNVLFTGRDYDAETGLYYYRARTLHPGLGRFMQHDPLMYVDGMNLYAYVGNAPSKYIDSYGLWEIWNPKITGIDPLKHYANVGSYAGKMQSKLNQLIPKLLAGGDKAGSMLKNGPGAGKAVGYGLMALGMLASLPAHSANETAGGILCENSKEPEVPENLLDALAMGAMKGADIGGNIGMVGGALIGGVTGGMAGATAGGVGAVPGAIMGAWGGANVGALIGMGVGVVVGAVAGGVQYANNVPSGVVMRKKRLPEYAGEFLYRMIGIINGNYDDTYHYQYNQGTQTGAGI